MPWRSSTDSRGPRSTLLALQSSKNGIGRTRRISIHNLSLIFVKVEPGEVKREPLNPAYNPCPPHLQTKRQKSCKFPQSSLPPLPHGYRELEAGAVLEIRRRMLWLALMSNCRAWATRRGDTKIVAGLS